MIDDDDRDIVVRPPTLSVVPTPVSGVTRTIRLGVDIGQAADPTALAAVEVVTDEHETTYIVRQLMRVPLQTPYPQVVQIVLKAVGMLSQQNLGLPSVYVDATGVGKGPVDYLIEPLRDISLLRPVQITYGEEMIRKADIEAYGATQAGLLRYGIRVGKAYLVGRLKAALQNGKIKAASSVEFDALKHELLTFEARSRGPNDKYGAMRSGEHDDLVIALALCVLDEATTEVNDLDDLNRDLPHGNVELHEGPELMGWSVW